MHSFHIACNNYYTPHIVYCVSPGESPDNSTQAPEEELTPGEVSENAWLTNAVPISAISLFLLGLMLLIGTVCAKCSDRCFERLDANDDHSDVSSQTRRILKLHLKAMKKAKAPKAAAVLAAVEKWRQDSAVVAKQKTAAAAVGRRIPFNAVNFISILK